jgi:perosamine synthetase
MIPLAVPHLAGREAAYLQECIDSTFVSSVGPFVTRFEEAVASAAGTAGAVPTSSGTTGLHLALTTVGVGRDDLVILPTLTFIASANAIAHCGASPWLFDVTQESWTLDPQQIADVLHDRAVPGPSGVVDRVTGRRIAAIMPVHTLGHPADTDALCDVAARYELPVVVDAAAALGATYRGRPIGQAPVRCSVFSFNGNKTVTAGGGGAVVADDLDVIERARHLSTTARVGSDYTHDQVGFNYRMTNLQAAVGCAQLEQLDTFVAAKKRIDATYRAELADLPGVTGFPRASWAESACWLSGVVVAEERREEVPGLLAGLQEAGIDARPFWKPMHLQPPYRGAPVETVERSGELWDRIVTLPSSSGLVEGDQRKVIDTVRSLLR